MVKLYENEVVTKHEFEMINITNEVKKAVADSGIKNGMVAVITKHTTTGIMINEALPCVEKRYRKCSWNALFQKIFLTYIPICFQLMEPVQEMPRVI